MPTWGHQCRFCSESTIEARTLLPAPSNWWCSETCEDFTCPQYIVAARLPSDSGVVVKRVIGLRAESYAVNDGIAYVNEEMWRESYLGPRMDTHPGRLSTNASRVMDVCYFMLGDNRGVSFDSCHAVAVHQDMILGRIRKRR